MSQGELLWGALATGVKNVWGKSDSQSRAEGCWFSAGVSVHVFLLCVLDQHLPASLLRQAVAGVAASENNKQLIAMLQNRVTSSAEELVVFLIVSLDNQCKKLLCWSCCFLPWVSGLLPHCDIFFVYSVPKSHHLILHLLILCLNRTKHVGTVMKFWLCSSVGATYL